MIELNVWLFVCVCLIMLFIGFVMGFLSSVAINLGFSYGASSKKRRRRRR